MFVVARKPKKDLVEELRQRRFESFPNIAQSSDANNVDDIDLNNGKEENAHDYDYLLSVSHILQGSNLSYNTHIIKCQFGLLLRSG